MITLACFVFCLYLCSGIVRFLDWGVPGRERVVKVATLFLFTGVETPSFHIAFLLFDICCL